MKVVRTDAAPAAIAEGALVFTSGQLPIDTVSGELRNSDIGTTVRQVLSNLRAVRFAGATDMNTVLKTAVFLSDMATSRHSTRSIPSSSGSHTRHGAVSRWSRCRKAPG